MSVLTRVAYAIQTWKQGLSMPPVPKVVKAEPAQVAVVACQCCPYLPIQENEIKGKICKAMLENPLAISLCLSVLSARCTKVPLMRACASPLGCERDTWG